MTNPNNAVGTNGAFGGRTSVNAFNDIMGAFQSRGVLSGWGISPSSGMTVSVGGNGTVRDVAVAEDANGNKTSINNISGAPISITLDSAPASNSRYDAIVAYVDKPPISSATQDNPECCGIIPVTGTAASTPVYPDDGAIRSAITADGASGSTAYYAVLGYIQVASGTTSITSGMITAGLNPTTNAMVDTAHLQDGSVTMDKLSYDVIYSYNGSSSMTYNSNQNYSKNPLNYKTLEFYAKESGGRSIYAKMRSPSSGDRICLSAFVTGNNGAADTFVRSAVLQLSSTGSTCVATGAFTASISNTISQNTTACVVLNEVRGYK